MTTATTRSSQHAQAAHYASPPAAGGEACKTCQCDNAVIGSTASTHHMGWSSVANTLPHSKPKKRRPGPLPSPPSRCVSTPDADAALFSTYPVGCAGPALGAGPPSLPSHNCGTQTTILYSHMLGSLIDSTWMPWFAHWVSMCSSAIHTRARARHNTCEAYPVLVAAAKMHLSASPRASFVALLCKCVASP